MPLFSQTPLTLPELTTALAAPQTLPANVAQRRLPAADHAPAHLLPAYACGTGPELPPALVRRMLLLHAQRLSHGDVAGATVRRLLDFYNREVCPVVFEQGGSALAHLSLPLLGLGEVNYQGYHLAAADVLGLFGWEPLALAPAEEMALLGGFAFSLAYATEALERTERLLRAADAIGALSAAALAVSVAAPPPQSAHQALRARVADVARTVEVELNSTADNPIIFPNENRILSGGNFYGQPLALALDHLALALAELGSLSERRTYQLLSGQRGLPAFLVAEPGLNSGLMMPHYTAASLVSQNKQLCTPASADSLTSSNGQEDYGSLGANATKARRVLENVEQILGIELFTAVQALDLRRAGGSARPGPALETVAAAFRQVVTFVPRDRVLYPDLHRAARFVREHGWQ